MSHSVVFVFLLVVAGLSAVDSQRPKKAKPCEKPITRKGWAGKCFSSQFDLEPRQCDSIVYDSTKENGCPDDGACCVDCSKQTKHVCNKGYAGSFGARTCCPGLLQVMTGRAGSGCVCCKDCKPKPRKCKRHGSRCITKNDPVYNETWCSDNGGIIKKRRCMGNGCWCCECTKENPCPEN